MAREFALVVGASSAIAKALCRQLLEDSDLMVVAISREFTAEFVERFGSHPRLRHYSCDYTPEHIERLVSQLSEWNGNFTKAFICNGMLHRDSIQPEKALEQLSGQTMLTLMEVNLVVPSLWLAKLLTLMRHDQPATVTLFSARVGSIGDNRLGGWYSYRCSKAALNMLIQTAAIEYRRRASNVKLLAFHPGTTDSPLSAPFQGRLKQGQLLTPDFVAERLLELIEEQQRDGTASYLDWRGQSIPW
ncbi:SDR family NAD(P)-dependent oxidoreductase [Paraferrimonas sedimenticola]|uniref:Short-chain dehydrogenase n=1 Tax=Paraferrimonas sedimenticola TaxID=375674 RepID=A0AA37VSW2_9GAMM|nr:SDR family NAD(P)-dependent oxidoreductase [Paraferrimonas sedimenticola]GLP95006.1 short-chain dehydrogenase [Paraferrimonas sedimenticola]